MIPAKNYETVFKFVKVMPRQLVASFFLDAVYIGLSTLFCKSVWLSILRHKKSQQYLSRLQTESIASMR